MTPINRKEGAVSRNKLNHSNYCMILRKALQGFLKSNNTVLPQRDMTTYQQMEQLKLCHSIIVIKAVLPEKRRIYFAELIHQVLAASSSLFAVAQVHPSLP